MGKKEADPSAELDEHGLVVQKHISTVLVVVPREEYDETTLRYARSSLYNVKVHTRVVSTDEEHLIRGALQDEFQPDGVVAGESMADYSGVLFCGGSGALAMADDPDALRLAQEARDQRKLIGAWGHAVAVLARAGCVAKRKVTGHPSLAELVRSAGGRYTGVQVQVDRNLVTGLDDAAGLRFGKALSQVVAI